MLSEMLGELNGSHTGARSSGQGSPMPTASLGAFFDEAYLGDGIKIKEILLPCRNFDFLLLAFPIFGYSSLGVFLGLYIKALHHPSLISTSTSSISAFYTILAFLFLDVSPSIILMVFTGNIHLPLSHFVLTSTSPSFSSCSFSLLFDSHIFLSPFIFFELLRRTIIFR